MDILSKIDVILGEAFVDVDKTYKIINKIDFGSLIKGYFVDLVNFVSGEWDKPMAINSLKNNTFIIKNNLKKKGLSEDEISEVRDVLNKVTKSVYDKYHISYFTDKNLFCIYVIDYWMGTFADWAGDKEVKNKLELIEKEIEKNFKIVLEKRFKNRKYGKAE